MVYMKPQARNSLQRDLMKTYSLKKKTSAERKPEIFEFRLFSFETPSISALRHWQFNVCLVVVSPWTTSLPHGGQ